MISKQERSQHPGAEMKKGHTALGVEVPRQTLLHPERWANSETKLLNPSEKAAVEQWCGTSVRQRGKSIHATNSIRGQSFCSAFSGKEKGGWAAYSQMPGSYPSLPLRTEPRPWWKRSQLSAWKTQTDACGCSFSCTAASWGRIQIHTNEHAKYSAWLTQKCVWRECASETSRHCLGLQERRTEAL